MFEDEVPLLISLFDLSELLLSKLLAFSFDFSFFLSGFSSSKPMGTELLDEPEPELDDPLPD